MPFPPWLSELIDQARADLATAQVRYDTLQTVAGHLDGPAAAVAQVTQQPVVGRDDHTPRPVRKPATPRPPKPTQAPKPAANGGSTYSKLGSPDLRRRIAEVLVEKGPLRNSEVAAALGLSQQTTHGVLKGEWFVRDANSRYTLSDAGRAALGAAGAPATPAPTETPGPEPEPEPEPASRPAQPDRSVKGQPERRARIAGLLAKFPTGLKAERIAPLLSLGLTKTVGDLDHDWFERTRDGFYTLTEAGKQAIAETQPAPAPKPASANAVTPDERRERIARHLSRSPATAGRLKDALSIPMPALTEALNHDWFACDRDGTYRITPACRAALFDTSDPSENPDEDDDEL